MHVSETKPALRKEAARLRALAHGARASESANALVGTFIEGLETEIAARPVVSLFWPMREEIDVRPLIAELRARGCTVALPVMQGRTEPLSFRSFDDELDLIEAAFGVFEPSSGQSVRPAVVAVPLLAFDQAGNRLGYGGGFYDRTLRALRAEGAVIAVGVAYDEQEMADVPVHGGDEPLDIVVTDRRFLDFRRSGR